MTRLVAEHFKRDGSPKRRYDSRDEAQRALGKKDRDHIYKCGFCGAWHRATPKSPSQGVKNR